MNSTQRRKSLDLFAKWRLEGQPLDVTAEQALALAKAEDVDLTGSRILADDRIPLSTVAKYTAARG